jgi:hypothetical protein
MTRSLVAVVLASGAVVSPAEAKVVVFQQPGFPAVDSEAPSREALEAALEGLAPTFADVRTLQSPETLKDADLLVLPYGSAFPADAWPAITDHLERGGNLMTLGGRPLWVPVFGDPSGFREGLPTSAYWRVLAAVAVTEVPRRDFARFAWDGLYGFDAPPPKARRVFAVNTLFVANYAAPQGNWRGLGFFLEARGRRVAAPVVRLDFGVVPRGRAGVGHGRFVMLPFEPAPGYWESAGGRGLVRQAARHALLDPALVWVEVPRVSLHEGEEAQAVLHLQDRDTRPDVARRVRVELGREGHVVDTRQLDCAVQCDVSLSFSGAEAPGLYEVRARFERDGHLVDGHETGFFRRDPALLATGSPLTAGRTYLRRGGRAFLPVGVNTWVNDTVWPFFPENANPLEWERDFAELASRGVSFVRTGFWHDRLQMIDSATGTARESVLRNIEAMLLAAARHGLHVQLVLFVFEPQTIRWGDRPLPGPGRNPFTDPVAVEAQAAFVRSIVARFKDVPHLHWDLLNEPNFSNPRRLWDGNQPNADPTEVEAWNAWLRRRYPSAAALSEAWGVPAGTIESIEGIELPRPEDLRLTRNGNPRQVRAVDYNLFAQDAFGEWARTMIRTIREAGSRQLITVGQDEGGITNRILNQFYGGAGVDLTSMHNWWQDDALLWDAVAAKRPGMPNLLGETGPQPSVAMRGESRWNETQALGLVERKLVMGLAAGNGGAAMWIWSRTDPYRVGRQDGSPTLWVDLLERVAGFAGQAEPHLTDERLPEIAIVLPQSLQLSAFHHYAVEAQQKCVRTLYHHARAAAYAVGEYQLDLLGDPKLILLPAPWVLSEEAWQALVAQVRAGATLLVTGRFDFDPHFRPTGRHRAVGLDYESAILDTRENPVRWPGGSGRATFSGDKTTFLEQARFASGETFVRRTLGAGRLLFFTLPLELGDDLSLLGAVYRWAMVEAGVSPAYRTQLDDPGIAIVPTSLDSATLYVLTSESSVPRDVGFVDRASGKELRVALPPGRAAARLVARDGRVLARYDALPVP